MTTTSSIHPFIHYPLAIVLLLAAASAPAAPDTQNLIHVAQLMYSGGKTSACFSDHFLTQAAQDARLHTDGQLTLVRLDSADLFQYPLVVMSGEGDFALAPDERAHLKSYLQHGGFLLASAGCSSPEWSTAFQRELATMFPDAPLQTLPMDHPVFHTVHNITRLIPKYGQAQPLQGLSLHDRLAVIYAPDGLNDTSRVQDCCCCGGNEIVNASDVLVNILAYALLN